MADNSSINGGGREQWCKGNRNLTLMVCILSQSLAHVRPLCVFTSDGLPQGNGSTIKAIPEIYTLRDHQQLSFIKGEDMWADALPIYRKN